MANSSMNLRNIVICPNHPDGFIVDDYQTGDMICTECGLVVGDRIIDCSAEWRSFDDDYTDYNPNRVGGAEDPLLRGIVASTMIGPATGPASFDESGALQYKNKKIVSGQEKILSGAFYEIAVMAARINLTASIVDRAKALYKELQARICLKRYSSQAKAAACIYLACRLEGAPRTFKEICAICRAEKKELVRCFKIILKKIGDGVNQISSDDFISRFCGNLGLPHAVQVSARHIARKANELNLVAGRSPLSVSGSAIYMATQAAGCKRDINKIAAVVGVTDVTIRKVYQLMYQHAAELFPNDFKFEIPNDNLPNDNSPKY